jgi:demethylmenaquinone methyltransferase/2-methoxy-6-polyprenyl-1,4-benzoquinol methylase
MNQGADPTLYYALRAGEYDRIYTKPERQKDLAALRALLRDTFAGHDVLEVACGTGYWTQVISESAKSVLATDINEKVLEVARSKSYSNSNVRFQIADAHTLADVACHFTAGFAGFWWSHIPRANLQAFLTAFHRKLLPGSLVVFLDNNYVEGSSTPVARRDADGNTYQKRKLENGTEFEVLKNFPTSAALRRDVSSHAADTVVAQFRHYWCLRYTLR